MCSFRVMSAVYSGVTHLVTGVFKRNLSRIVGIQMAVNILYLKKFIQVEFATCCVTFFPHFHHQYTIASRENM